MCAKRTLQNTVGMAGAEKMINKYLDGITIQDIVDTCKDVCADNYEI